MKILRWNLRVKILPKIWTKISSKFEPPIFSFFDKNVWKIDPQKIIPLEFAFFPPVETKILKPEQKKWVVPYKSFIFVPLPGGKKTSFLSVFPINRQEICAFFFSFSKMGHFWGSKLTQKWPPFWVQNWTSNSTLKSIPVFWFFFLKKELNDKVIEKQKEPDSSTFVVV